MKLKTVAFRDFKGIDNLEIPLNGKSTILFGINGVGKSSILRGINLLYANIIAKLTASKKQAELEYDDISYGKSGASVRAVFSFADGGGTAYGVCINRSSGKKHKPEELRTLVEEFEKRYLVKGYDDGSGNWVEEEDAKNMPVFANYGVNRLVIDVPVRVSSREQFTKLSAFDRAIERKIDFRNLFKWFRNQEDIENQNKVRKSAGYEDRSLSAVKNAMLAMLDGFEDIYIDRNPLAMKVKKDGRNLKMNQLSDGEKCTIALFGDLARRMALANPSRSNPLEGSGVVLIDELDLHMHTSWQRKVMGVLRQTFPNIQFIITTHSPQILGEMDNDCNLFYMARDGRKIDLKLYGSFIGWDANVILEEVMHTSSLNEKIKEQVEQMFAYVDSGEYDKAEAVADMLDEKADGYIDGTAKARVLIARGRRREKNR